MGAPKTAPKMYRKQVEEILKKYPLYKQALRLQLHPSTTMDYETERVDGGEREYASSTEKYGVLRAEYRQLVNQVEATLKILNDDEKTVVELTYFESVAFAWEVIGWSKGHYYRKRNATLEKIAIVLNMI